MADIFIRVHIVQKLLSGHTHLRPTALLGPLSRLGQVLKLTAQNLSNHGLITTGQQMGNT